MLILSFFVIGSLLPTAEALLLGWFALNCVQANNVFVFLSSNSRFLFSHSVGTPCLCFTSVGVEFTMIWQALKGMPCHTHWLAFLKFSADRDVTFGWFFEQTDPQKAVAQQGKIRYGLLGSSAQEIPTPVCQPDTFDSIMVFMGPLKNRLSWAVGESCFGRSPNGQTCLPGWSAWAEEGRCLLNCFLLDISIKQCKTAPPLSVAFLNLTVLYLSPCSSLSLLLTSFRAL